MQRLLIVVTAMVLALGTASAASAPGLQESFWLWPDDRVASSVSWPAAGEINIIDYVRVWK